MSPVTAPTGSRIVRRTDGAPVVAVRVVLPGGARREVTPGQALVAGRLLVEGTGQRDWRRLAADAEALGISYDGFGGVDGHGLAVDALAIDWEPALELAAELLLDASFPADRFDWVVRHAAAELEAQADHPEVLTGRAFAAELYGSHPKGRPLQGDATSLAALERDDAAGFHREAVARGGFVTVTGAIDSEAVEARLEELFAGLAPGRVDDYRPPAWPPPSARRREVETRARGQAHLFVGAVTVAREDPDFEALELAGVALGSGAGLSGRIPNRLRDRDGLGYAAWADLAIGAGRDAGRFVAYLGTSPRNVERAERAIREEVARLVDGGLTRQELDEARSYLVGREPFRRETARQNADLAAHAAVLGVPVDDPAWRLELLEAVSLDDVRAALARHLDPERLVVTVGRPKPRRRRPAG